MERERRVERGRTSGAFSRVSASGARADEWCVGTVVVVSCSRRAYSRGGAERTSLSAVLASRLSSRGRRAYQQAPLHLQRVKVASQPALPTLVIIFTPCDAGGKSDHGQQGDKEDSHLRRLFNPYRWMILPIIPLLGGAPRSLKKRKVVFFLRIMSSLRVAQSVQRINQFVQGFVHVDLFGALLGQCERFSYERKSLSFAKSNSGVQSEGNIQAVQFEGFQVDAEQVVQAQFVQEEANSIAGGSSTFIQETQGWSFFQKTQGWGSQFFTDTLIPYNGRENGQVGRVGQIVGRVGGKKWDEWDRLCRTTPSTTQVRTRPQKYSSDGLFFQAGSDVW